MGMNALAKRCGWRAMSARWAAALVLGFALALAMPATALAAEGDKAASADDGAAAPKESVELVCKPPLPA